MNPQQPPGSPIPENKNPAPETTEIDNPDAESPEDTAPKPKPIAEFVAAEEREQRKFSTVITSLIVLIILATILAILLYVR